ncbi:MAG: TolC family protein [Caulobacteraceae bacterium]|nr:TolC family protein [Caulobacteraceae bacterium]
MKALRTLTLVATAGAVLGACAHYEPRPVAPEKFAARYDAVRLDPPPPGAAWSNQALLAAAIAHSPAVRESEANYRAARAAAKASRTPPPITLLLIAEYSRDAGGTTPWLYNGLLNIPLDYGAKRSARLNAADLVAVQALYDYAEAIWTVRSAVVHARIQRLASEQEAVLAQLAVQLREDRARKLEQRIRSGEDARPAGITAAIELAAAQRRLQDLTNLRVQADAVLAKALGAPVSAVEPIVLEPLPDSVEPPAGPDLIAWRQEAVLRRRDVLRAVADYDIAEQGLRLEVAKQRPDVQLGPSYTFERGQHKIPFDLTLVLPPRDLNRANIRSAEAKRAQAGAKLDTVQAAVLAGVDQTSAALAGAKAGLDRALGQDLPLARRADTAARKALAAGELDRTDQEAAQAAAVDAEIAVLEAWRLTWTAVADLEDALRRPSPGEAAVLEAAVKRAGDSQ